MKDLPVEAASAVGRRPRGRPRSFDRDQVLGEAVKVFWARGYDAASIEELTAALGIKRSSLYHEFGGKEALFLAAVDHYVEQLVSPCLDRLNKGRSLTTDLSDFLDAILALTGQPHGPRGCLVASVLTDAAEASPQFREKLIECLEALDATFAGRFEQARRSGDLPDGENVEALAQIFVSFSQGLTLRARSGVSIKLLRELADAGLERLIPRPSTVVN